MYIFERLRPGTFILILIDCIWTLQHADGSTVGFVHLSGSKRKKKHSFIRANNEKR